MTAATIVSFVMHPLQGWASVLHCSVSVDKRTYAPKCADMHACRQLRHDGRALYGAYRPLR
jgi:hypothetical protein